MAFEVRSATKETPAHGYSNTLEEQYVLTEDSVIPLAILFEGDLMDRIAQVREQFAEFCRERQYNICVPAVYHRFVHFMVGNSDKKKARRYINTMNLYRDALSRVNKGFATPESLVKYETLSADPIYKDQYPGDTKEARAARNVQRKVKDAVIMTLDPEKPVLDVGGGNGSMVDHALDLGIVLKDYTNVDLKNRECSKDINDVDYELLIPETQVVSNHTSYYFHLTKMPSFINTNPRGIVLVLDPPSRLETFKVNGEGYYFNCQLMPNLDVHAYRVSGAIYQGSPSKGVKGRRIADELWYTRRQWAMWGFDMLTFPNSSIQLIREHLVQFSRNVPRRKCERAQEPLAVELSVASDNIDVKSDLPPLYDVLEGGLNKEKHALYHGVPLYQTPKLDGIAMKLYVAPNGLIILIDRKRQTYNIIHNNSPLYAEGITKFSAAVELLPEYGTKARFKLFLNQVIKPVVRGFHDALDEIVGTVEHVNRCVGWDFLGRKDYYYTRNEVLKFSSALPHDGVIYVPAMQTACTHRSVRIGAVHTYLKPFASTDTNHEVLMEWLKKRNRVSEQVALYYRLDGRATVITNPIDQRVRKAMARFVHNSAVTDNSQSANPLLYELFHMPKGTFLEHQETILVSHVRGDKSNHSQEIAITTLMPGHKDGRFLFTRFSDPGCLDQVFLSNMSSSRVIKTLPEQIGIEPDFIVSFFDMWRADDAVFVDLNRKVVDQGGKKVYYGLLEDFHKSLRKIFKYNVPNYLIETIMRLPLVQRTITYRRRRVDVYITIPIGEINVKPDVVLPLQAF